MLKRYLYGIVSLLVITWCTCVSGADIEAQNQGVATGMFTISLSGNLYRGEAMDWDWYGTEGSDHDAYFKLRYSSGFTVFGDHVDGQKTSNYVRTDMNIDVPYTLIWRYNLNEMEPGKPFVLELMITDEKDGTINGTVDAFFKMKAFANLVDGSMGESEPFEDRGLAPLRFGFDVTMSFDIETPISIPFGGFVQEFNEQTDPQRFDLQDGDTALPLECVMALKGELADGIATGVVEVVTENSRYEIPVTIPVKNEWIPVEIPTLLNLREPEDVHVVMKLGYASSLRFKIINSFSIPDYRDRRGEPFAPVVMNTPWFSAQLKTELPVLHEFFITKEEPPDTTAPVGSLDAARTVVKDSRIHVRLSAEDNKDQQDALSYVLWGSWEDENAKEQWRPLQETVSYELPESFGTFVLYCAFRDSEGNISEVYEFPFERISLDTEIISLPDVTFMDELTVIWENTPESSANMYRLEYKEEGQELWSLYSDEQGVYDLTAARARIQVKPGSVYMFRIRGGRDGVFEGGESLPVKKVQVMDYKPVLSVSAEDDQIIFTWEPVTVPVFSRLQILEVIDGHDYIKADLPPKNIDDTSFAIKGFPRGEHVFKARLILEDGEYSDSEAVSVFVEGYVPNLTVDVSNGNEANLYWKIYDGDAFEHYVIFASETPDPVYSEEGVIAVIDDNTINSYFLKIPYGAPLYLSIGVKTRDMDISGIRFWTIKAQPEEFVPVIQGKMTSGAIALWWTIPKGVCRENASVELYGSNQEGFMPSVLNKLYQVTDLANPALNKYIVRDYDGTEPLFFKLVYFDGVKSHISNEYRVTPKPADTVVTTGSVSPVVCETLELKSKTQPTTGRHYFIITSRLRNTGSVPITNIKIKYYLSKDAQLDENDTILLSYKLDEIGVGAAGVKTITSTSYRVKKEIFESGPYYAIAAVDPDEDYFEFTKDSMYITPDAVLFTRGYGLNSDSEAR